MENKKRLKNLFFVISILMVIAIGYYILYVNYPSFVVKCMFKQMTGFKCPGCGVTRMLVNFMEFDFMDGVKYNIFLAATLPFVVYIIVYSAYLYLVDKKGNKVFNVSCYVYAVLLVVWGIVRNIIGC
jgi:hypothetical protein